VTAKFDKSGRLEQVLCKPSSEAWFDSALFAWLFAAEQASAVCLLKQAYTLEQDVNSLGGLRPHPARGT
jgi:hypothetical protein